MLEDLSNLIEESHRIIQCLIYLNSYFAVLLIYRNQFLRSLHLAQIYSLVANQIHANSYFSFGLLYISVATANNLLYSQIRFASLEYLLINLKVDFVMHLFQSVPVILFLVLVWFLLKLLTVFA